MESLLALPAGAWKYEWFDILTGAVTAETRRRETWVTKVRGERRGGGAALRATRVFPVVVEDFESYVSEEAFRKQWHNVRHGGVTRQSLDPAVKHGGRYAMKCAYATTRSPDRFYSPVCRVSRWELTGCNAFRFWFKPDGSGRELTVQLNAATRQGRNVHDLWETTLCPQKGDTAARWVTLPFAAPAHNVQYADAPEWSPEFRPEAAIEVTLYIGGREDDPGEGAYYFDDMEGVFVE